MKNNEKYHALIRRIGNLNGTTKKDNTLYRLAVGSPLSDRYLFDRCIAV